MIFYIVCMNPWNDLFMESIIKTSLKRCTIVWCVSSSSIYTKCFRTRSQKEQQETVGWVSKNSFIDTVSIFNWGRWHEDLLGHFKTVVFEKSHSSWWTTLAALTGNMPLVYPWAVNSWSTGSHIINTNKTLSPCSRFTSTQPQAVREAFGGEERRLNWLTPRSSVQILGASWSPRIDITTYSPRRHLEANLFQADPEGRFPGDDSDVSGEGAHLFSQDILHIVTRELQHVVHGGRKREISKPHIWQRNSPTYFTSSSAQKYTIW